MEVKNNLLACGMKLVTKVWMVFVTTIRMERLSYASATRIGKLTVGLAKQV